LLYILENIAIKKKLICKNYNNFLTKYFEIKKILNLF